MKFRPAVFVVLVVALSSTQSSRAFFQNKNEDFVSRRMPSRVGTATTGFTNYVTALSNARQNVVRPDDMSPRRVTPDDYGDRYAQWCFQYGKRYDASRLPIFTENLKQLEAYKRQTGIEMKLNEYSDLSAQEYNAIMKSGSRTPPVYGSSSSPSASASPSPSIPSSSSRDDQWTKRSSPSYDDKGNFSPAMRNSNINLDSRLPTSINRGGVSQTISLEQDEEERAIRAYEEWCKKYGRPMSDGRFERFRVNYRQVEAHKRKTGKTIELNEYADSTQEEFKAMQQSRESEVNDGFFASPVSYSNRSREGSGQGGIMDAAIRRGQERARLEEEARMRAERDARFKMEEARMKAEKAEQEKLREEHQAKLRAEQELRQERLRAEEEQLRRQEMSSNGGQNLQGVNFRRNDPDRQTRVNLNDTVQTFATGQIPRSNSKRDNSNQNSGTSFASKLQRDNHDQNARLRLDDAFQSFGIGNGERPGLKNDDLDKKVSLNLKNEYQKIGSEAKTGFPEDLQSKLDRSENIQGYSGPNARGRENLSKKFLKRQTGQITSPTLLRDQHDQRARLNLSDAFQSFGAEELKSKQFRRNKPDQQTTQKQFQPKETEQVDDKRVRSIYKNWCSKHGKEFDERRLRIFSDNLKSSEEYGKETGQPVALNEFSDLSMEEFNGLRDARIKMEEEARLKAEKNVRLAAEQSERLRAEAEARKKAEEEARRLAAENARIRAEAEAKVRAEQEAERAEIERVRDAYGLWCLKYGKDFDEERVNHFASNFYQMEEYERVTGKKMELNEHSDLSAEEYKIVKKKEDILKAEQISKAEEARIRAETEARIRAEEEGKRMKQFEEELRIKAEEDARVKVEEEARRKFEEDARRKQEKMEQPLFDLNAVYKSYEDSRSLSGSDAGFSAASNTQDRVRHAYREWCKFYDKEYDSKRLNIFATNAKKVSTYYENTGTSMKLNGYADRTAEEYREMQKAKVLASAGGGSVDSIVSGKSKKGSVTKGSLSDAESYRGNKPDLNKIRNAYAEWCITYGKEFDEVRFVNFAANMKQMEAYQKASGKSVELNEYSDLTAEEYQEMIKANPEAAEARLRTSPPRSAPRPPPPHSAESKSKSNGLIREADFVRSKVKRPGMPEEEPSIPLNPPQEAQVPTKQPVPRGRQSERPAPEEMQGNDEIEISKQMLVTEVGDNDNDGVPAPKPSNFLGDSLDAYKGNYPSNVVEAYEKFCKEFGKEYDESRLPSFQNNFLAAEEYFEKNGSRVELNEYADLSREEYMAMVEADSAEEGDEEDEPPEFEGGFELEPEPETEETVARSKPVKEPPVWVQNDVEDAIPEDKPEVSPQSDTSMWTARGTPRLVFKEESIDDAVIFPSPAEMFKRKMEEEARKEQEEEERMLRQAEEEYRLSMSGNAPKPPAPIGGRKNTAKMGPSPNQAAAAAKREAEDARGKAAQDEERRRVQAEAKRRATEEEAIKKRAVEQERVRAEEEARMKELEDDRIRAEAETRRKAEEAIKREKELEHMKAEIEAKIRAEYEAKAKAEAKRAAEEDERINAEMRRKAEEEARKKAEDEARIKAKMEEEERKKAEEARHRADLEARLQAHREKERIKAEAEAKRLAEEEARIREEEIARREAGEAKIKAEAEARLKAKIQAKLKEEENERLKRAEEARIKAEMEAKRMAVEAARQNKREVTPPNQIYLQGPKFENKRSPPYSIYDEIDAEVEAAASNARPKLNNLFKNLSGFLDDETTEEETDRFSAQADALLAEAKRFAENEDERIMQIKAETEEWKKIQRSLELEAAARERERKVTERIGKQAAKAIDILENLKNEETMEAEEARKLARKLTEKSDEENSDNLLSVFDGLMYVLGGNSDDTIGKPDDEPVRPKVMRSIAPELEIQGEDPGRTTTMDYSEGRVVTPENVPVLSRWIVNADDNSITGYVRNSPEYDNGTEITIIPIGKGVKRGTVVTTASGKQYKLS